MPAIAPWIESVLWRAHDWRAALEHLAIELASRPDSAAVQRAAAELGRASEYIEPDRRRAIDIYGLAGPAERKRARELVVELGWWAGRARLSALGADADPALLLDEAEGWWDAGQPALCAFALAGVRITDETRVEDLAGLLGGTDLLDHGKAIARRAEDLTGAAAADAYIMAARYAHAAGFAIERTRWLEAALAARPGHPIAAAQLLANAFANGDPVLLRTFLRVRFEHLPPAAWIEGMRTTAFAMIDGGEHRGFGLRLLRRVLERAYEAKLPEIPGHLAIWQVLASHATVGARRDLLELAITGLQSSRAAVDRVWLAALATEISLRDSASVIIAGAYAELVAEHAPDHPIVHELIASVAAEDRAEAAIPQEAIAAATAQLPHVTVDEVERARAYADAIDSALGQPAVAPVPPASSGPVASTAVAVPPPGAVASALPASGSAPAPVALPPTPSKPIPIAIPPTHAKSMPIPIPIPMQTSRPITIAIPPVKPSIAKPSKAGSAVTSTQSLPPLAKPPLPPPPPDSKRLGRRPSNPDELFTALRTPDRPAVPPPNPDPPGAIPRSRRISVPIDVRLVLPDGRRIEGHSRDLSTSGLFVIAQSPTVEAAVRVDGELDIVLLLPGDEPFVENEHRARVRVARRDADGIGVLLIDPAAPLVAALTKLIE